MNIIRNHFSLLRKELIEVIQNSYSFWLLILIPTILIIFSGQLNSRLLTFWVYVEEPESPGELGKSKLEEILKLFDNVHLLENPNPSSSVREFFSNNHLDIYYKYDNGWKPITQQITGTKKNQSLYLSAQVAFLIDKYESENKLMDISLLRQFGGVEELFPSISTKDLSLVPGMLVVVSTFLAFLLAISGFYRERENNMLFILLSFSDLKLPSVYFIKGIFAVGISMLVSIYLMVICACYYGFSIKENLISIILLLFAVNLSSALLGLIFSTLCKTNTQIVYSTGVYLICLIVFTGLAYPLDGASVIVISISKIFPLTYCYTPFRAWMEHGTSSFRFQPEWLQAVFQLFFYLLISWRFLKKFERSL